MNILIIEDDTACRDLIKLHLLKFKDTFYSLEMYEAGTIKEAKEAYELREPDLVILDGTLTDSPFEETLKLIPTFSRNSAVVMLTNQEKSEGVAAAFRMGAVDYLTKQTLTDGKAFIKSLSTAWSSFERQKIKQTGAFPTLRVKTVGEELLNVAEKSMSQHELKALIEFSNYAKGSLEDAQKKIEKMHQTIYEGSNGGPSMKQDLSELKGKIDDMKRKLDESLEVKKTESSERWKFLSALVGGGVLILTPLTTIIIKYFEHLFNLGK